ncbi:beta-ribofuranosylaminobenzene 5'-phosphate synthase family protein [Thermococcus gorgonarius]|uniref:Beta-ribofuranosylaminobenzene 5'-phosphate synthase n=1 Tax=Thermococcus gorgonarius TaxID=71997 RepID=A0A2Z2M487_THEGO|nr:beta-ribofuranosylaminobenzene 5'-phosphate synthase family protein [Thermococcus gorgonarius]ASJ00710.1 GHMP kinase [Thermococcus gorgonarius]
MLIETPKRIHMGIIDPTGELGRKFGGMGVAVEGGYRIRVTPSSSLRIEAGNEDRETIEWAIKKMNSKFETGTSYRIEVLRSIPRHRGLGSTTQLSLAVGVAISRLTGLKLSVEEIAEALGRGKNSGVGIYAFKVGGFVVDGGVKNGLPPLIVRHEFPEEWALLLITPHLRPGFDEREEEPIMESTKGDPKAAMEISRTLIMGLLPALVERNIAEFGKHLTAIQRLVGRHFSEHQGGEFREDVKLILDFLSRETYGYGQSSWGPTVYGLIHREDGEELASRARDYLKEHGIEGTVEIGVPRNRGAEIIQESSFIERIIKEAGK